MNIKFSKLTIENFLSFGYAEIDLRDRGFTLVNGVNRNPDDNARSNGSGKSAIWDAISWALTGTTIRGISKDIVNIHTTGGCKVELEFSLDKHNYIIKRYKDHSEFGSTIKFFVDGKDESGKGIRDTEKIIQGALPEVTSSLLGSVVILGQGLPQRFSNNTPSGRKEVLESLSKSDFMIEDIKKRLSVRKDELNKELREAQDGKLSINSQKSLLETQLEATKKSLTELDNEKIDPSLVSQFEAQIKEREEELKILQGKKEELYVTKNTISIDITKVKLDTSSEIDAIVKSYEQEKETLNNKQIELNSSIKVQKARLQEIENIRDTCPTCGQKLPEVYKPNPEPLRAQIEELTKLLDQARADYEHVIQSIEIETEEIVSKYASKTKQLEEENNKVTKSLEEISNQIKSVENSIRGTRTELDTLNVSISTHEARKAELENTVKTTSSKIEDLSSQNLYYIEKEESAKLHLDVVNKMITIATRDFRGYLLTNVISFIDKKAKEYSMDIFGTNKLQFVLDGNNINIIYDDKPYENLSGGERQRLDIIVQFALRDMLCQFSGFACSILVLDELFDNLDSSGCDNVLNLITKRLTDIESVFIITHHSDISIPADSIITVYKDERGISSVR